MSGPRVVSDETATLSQAHIPKDSWFYAHEDAQTKKAPDDAEAYQALNIIWMKY
ncbi:hypothetical protein SODG_002780 [Sodalis praecaptivus]